MSLVWDQTLVKGEQAQNAEDYVEAEKIFTGALAEAEGFPPEDPRLSFLLRLLAGVCFSQNRLQEAEAWMAKSLAACEKSTDKDTVELPKSLESCAKLLSALGRDAEAEPYLKRAVEFREKAFGPVSPGLVGVLETYAKVLTKLGRAADAQAAKARSEKIFAEVGRVEPKAPRVLSEASNTGWTKPGEATPGGPVGVEPVGVGAKPGEGAISEHDPSGKRKDGTAEQGIEDKEPKGKAPPKEGTAEQGATDPKKKDK